MNQSNPVPIRRALISVSDKDGVVELARALDGLGVEILSTGGTAKLLMEATVPVVEVSDYTGFPEIMGGRVKTLHPKIHGGLLGRRDTDGPIMTRLGIPSIDLLVVNLYPFQATVDRPDCDLAMAVENIDIGGPAMLRSAAKNHDAVTVVVDRADYPSLIQEMEEHGGAVSAPSRLRYAAKAFRHTAGYDTAIATYLAGVAAGDERGELPALHGAQYVRAQRMRYGENPHQRAAFYVEEHPAEACVATARQLQGKALSFNNVADTDAALECVKAFDAPACVIVKHANPCGVAIASGLLEAYERAHRTDPTSAFGGIIAFNRSLDPATAKAVIGRQFVEVIVAPEVDEAALEVLRAKSNLRVLACGQWNAERAPGLDYKRVNGGLLIQERDIAAVGPDGLEVVTRRAPDERELDDLLFAWKLVKFVKSNAIVYCRDGASVGIGAGQMSRVYSARIAAMKARDEGLEVAGSVMASDAFFPFRDGIDSAAEAGITAVVQPGGSVRDAEVIAAADEHGMAMVFTAMRHFRH